MPFPWSSLENAGGGARGEDTGVRVAGSRATAVAAATTDGINDAAESGKPQRGGRGRLVLGLRDTGGLDDPPRAAAVISLQALPHRVWSQATGACPLNPAKFVLLLCTYRHPCFPSSEQMVEKRSVVFSARFFQIGKGCRNLSIPDEAFSERSGREPSENTVLDLSTATVCRATNERR